MTTRDIDLARARLSYLVRGLWNNVDWDRIPKDRRGNLSKELSEQLYPLAISERSTLGWVRGLAARFSINLSPSAANRFSAFTIIPRVFLDASIPTIPSTKLAEDEALVRWDILSRSIPFDALRVVLHENQMLVSTFALAPAFDQEESLFLPIAEERNAASGYKPTLPKQIIPRRQFRTVWTATSALHHGSDEKHGNVSLFRREQSIDVLADKLCLVPFLSGNSVRGLWRDMFFARLLELVGDIKFSDLPPQRAHALLSGGSIEAGSDTGKVDVELRRRARAICPAWDLIAGCIDGQIMSGLLSVSDAVLVCQENAWKLHQELAPSMPLEEFAASLKPADRLTQLRLLTRQVHREIGSTAGHQMLVNVEALLPGAQLLHSFMVRGLDGVSELASSCLTDLLEQFQASGKYGAKTGAGYGTIAFDRYMPGEGMPELSCSAIYQDWVAANREEIRAWLLGGSSSTGAGTTTTVTADEFNAAHAAELAPLEKPKKARAKKAAPVEAF